MALFRLCHGRSLRTCDKYKAITDSLYCCHCLRVGLKNLGIELRVSEIAASRILICISNPWADTNPCDFVHLYNDFGVSA